MITEIVLGEGRYKIGLITREGRVGILLAPMETAYPVGHTFEERTEAAVVPGSTIIWSTSTDGVRVLQDAVNAMALHSAGKLRRLSQG